jgi:CheY-like chemotaxis protein
MKGQALIIDDSPIDIKMVSSVLESQGYSCFGFTDHKEALKWTEENKPQLIFLDLQMPVLTGYQLIPMLRRNENTEKCPIVIISGKNQIEDVKKAIKAGAHDYIVKPIDALVLQEKVKKMDPSIQGENFASTQVQRGSLDSVHIATRIETLEVSEFGVKLLTNFPINAGEMIELGGTLEFFGSEYMLIRCLSCAKGGDGKTFISQFTFIGATEANRVLIRQLCRKQWVAGREGKLG